MQAGTLLTLLGAHFKVLLLDTRWFRSRFDKADPRQPGRGPYTSSSDATRTMLGYEALSSSVIIYATVCKQECAVGLASRVAGARSLSHLLSLSLACSFYFCLSLARPLAALSLSLGLLTGMVELLTVLSGMECRPPEPQWGESSAHKFE